MNTYAGTPESPLSCKFCSLTTLPHFLGCSELAQGLLPRVYKSWTTAVSCLLVAVLL